MKKVISLLLCLVTLTACFAACSAKNNDVTQNGEVAIGEITTKYRQKKHTTTNAQITTERFKSADFSKISREQASALIQSYSDEELGISKDDRQLCSFIISDAAEKIKRTNYIKINAVIKIAHIDESNGSKTYTTEIKGEYYLHPKGKNLLKKNLATGELEEMKLKELPTE